jgi:hypothetical protein
VERHVHVVGADGDVAARRDDHVGVVDDGQRRGLERVAGMQPEGVEPAEYVFAVVSTEELRWCQYAAAVTRNP